jgi:guanyl-specific ribonuclease Sa
MQIHGFTQSGRLCFLLCLLWSNGAESADSCPASVTTGTLAGPAETGDAPQKARDLLKAIMERDGAALPGYVGGQNFHNRERRLPRGRYREYDVNPRSRTSRRDAERLIIEQRTGKAYYTPDHYRTFVPLN